MKKKKTRNKLILHPVMTLLLLCIIVILLSGILNLFNFSFFYNTLNTSKLDYITSTESVTSLLNLRGVKYIFSNTVSNFANFTVLSHYIILLLGIGIMEYSGFLKTAVGVLTRKAKKRTLTFVIVFVCLIASIIDNVPFIAFIPLTALIFKHGKRNPNIGIIASFAALTCGYGLSLLITSVDSSLLTITLDSAHMLDQTYSIGSLSFILIMAVAIIGLSFIITYITENVIARKAPKYEFKEEDVLENRDLNHREKKGLLLSSLVALLYLIIVIYNIIPGLPFSGNFLNYRETLYIDKLFGPESFFSDGFIFIVTLLFIILGLFYGIGAKTIRNNSDFIEGLGHSLNGIGKSLVYIFAAATFISIFKQTNIGNVVTAGLTEFITNCGITGLPLIIIFFVICAICTFLVPSSVTRWSIMAYSIVPVFLNAGISAEFTQVVFRFGECATIGLTPLFTYYCLYLACLEKENSNGDPILLNESIKYQLPYAGATAAFLLALIIIWYIISLPLGISGSVLV